jgi:hypothetical protein
VTYLIRDLIPKHQVSGRTRDHTEPRRDTERPIAHLVELVRTLHIERQTRTDGMSSETGDQETKATEEVVVFHFGTKRGLYWMQDGSRSGGLGEAVDQENHNQEEGGEEGDEGWDGQEVQRQQGRGNNDEESDNLVGVGGETAQDGMKRIAEQYDPCDRKCE